jgi:hypothetical protein
MTLRATHPFALRRMGGPVNATADRNIGKSRAVATIW